MREADVVVAATSSAEALLDRCDVENLMKARCNRPLLLIDLSVPRNIDAVVGDLDGVSLYNIDDLEAMARESMRNRARELAACDQIIEAHVGAVIGKLNFENQRSNAADRNSRLLRPNFATVPGLLLQSSHQKPATVRSYPRLRPKFNALNEVIKFVT
jgi:glutamyl-tRNA reductase